MHSIILIGVVVGREWIIECTRCTPSATSWVADRLPPIAGRWQSAVHSDLIVPSLLSQRWLSIFKRPSKYSSRRVLECPRSSSPSLHQYLAHQHPVLFAFFCPHLSYVNSISRVSSSSRR
jgi:hypothetical protein